MKKYAQIIVLALVIVLATAGVAYANFGPHGGYIGDTDACAGCHRAHTSFSSIQRTEYLNGAPIGTVGSALLVSNAENMTEFCNACHGELAPGASTNVVAGIFDSGPSALIGDTTVDETPTNPDGGAASEALYVTNSTFAATLNGGGFQTMEGTDSDPIAAGTAVSSAHSMQGLTLTGESALNNNSAPMWGFGSAVSTSRTSLGDFTCTSCHDPHGSSNYRLLKDTLPGDTRVGGYLADGVTPDPFVVSAEEGYPANGWEKHVNPNTGGYVPNYTAAEYRNNGNMAENISGWCAGCHTEYSKSGTAYDYEGDMADGVNEVQDTVTGVVYYRHPVNRVVADITSSSLAVEPTISADLPLEVDMAADAQEMWALNESTIGCLTCHRAHGTNASMSGWAESSLTYNATPADGAPEWSVELDDGSGGVNPNKSSALLRLDNRGVCERCHNK